MLHGNIKLVLIMTILFSSVVVRTAHSLDDQATEESVRKHVEQLPRAAAEGRRRPVDHSSLTEITDWLRSAPKDLVIPEIVEALQNSPAYQESAVRRAAYALLRDIGAATTDVGVRQLLEGVHDRDGRSACLMALGLTPVERHPELVQSLGQLLREEDVAEHHLRRAIELLGTTRHVARPMLSAIVEFYRNEEMEGATRTAAAGAMVLVGDVLWAIERFGLQDIGKRSSEEATIIISALTLGGSETEGTFGIDPHLRAIPRALILSAFKHKDSSVRRAAAWALLVSYTLEEAVVEAAPGEYRVNPTISDAFETMMANDADPILRQVAAQAHDDMFPRWIERRRQRAEEEPSPADDP